MRSCIGSRALCSVCACRFRRRIRNRSDQRSMDDFGQGWYFIGCDSGRDSSCTICSDHTRQWGEVCQKVCIKLAKLGHVQLRVDEPFPPPSTTPMPPPSVACSTACAPILGNKREGYMPLLFAKFEHRMSSTALVSRFSFEVFIVERLTFAFLLASCPHLVLHCEL